ncbi:MAG: site-specific integrase, partial [Clostridia bacterium]|nr:site-specific integrase [Clostridia bacterium]
KRFKRKVVINGVERWISADTEQEYAENLMKLMGGTRPETVKSSGHNFRAYAKNWFVTYSNPNIERATAQTYQRQLTCHIFPALGDMDVEDITTDHIQTLFNGMDVSKASKDKTRMVLNMIFGMALDDDIIAKNPMKSKRLRITGRESKPTEEYSIEQMRYLIGHISDVKNDTDRAYLTLQALHPLRLEEVLGLKWADVDREHMQLHICRAVTHPTRNMPEVKVPKTKASIRSVGLSKLALEMLGDGDPDEFVIGGDKPFSYTQVRKMCERIRRDTGFDDKITPIRFRTTVLTDIYDQTKDIKQAQAAAGHTTATMTLKYYVKGRSGTHDATSAVERAYGVD